MSKKAALSSQPHQPWQSSNIVSPVQLSNNSSSEAGQENQPTQSNNANVFNQTFTSEPPPYSSLVTNTPSTLSPAAWPNATSTLPPIDFSKYSIPESSLSKDGSTVSTYHPSFTSNASALVRFVQEQATLPPLPYIHILGEKQEDGQRRDFDIKINMLSLFLAQNSQNKWNYVKLVGDQELAYRGKDGQSTIPDIKGGLDEWATRFCKETSTLKSFTLTRQLSNWNASYIEGQIRSLIAATGYEKRVTISFPVKYAKVVVYPPKSSQSFFKTLVSPFLEKKRFEVVRAVWPYASLPPVADAAAAGRKCVVQSEEMWWEEWRDVIRWSVVTKRSGWVSVDDILEYRMAPAPAVPPSNPWKRF
ncbi:hypothetical protein BGW36DRAFT_317990 [Talaromyces proteolyticus]|uniref:Uncharacterized protein n=1 Tax=Talaromyces proteolyticus TaxID=1131652 RepID=A0AAD4KQZ0_9EURO|nr:uncharacterized protein BGW36DRAFT_317990 [Talaromyces proteolyticus]KAH8698495.1 hypothetical protein BGW36DRAFT_317990 [Talaromyces proteolyticus]